MILLLHTLIEGIVGLLFLFYPGVGDLVPGFGTSEGASFELLLRMHGLAALFLSGLSLYAYLKRTHTPTFLLVTLSLAIYHFAMILVQTLYNPDQRAALLHFLLAIFLTGRYLGRRKLGWEHDRSRLN